jgi:hypothetical protein
VLNKSSPNIRKYYERFDESFRDGREVSRRLRTAFDAISGLLGVDDIRNLLSTRSLFFALFAAIYGLQYGIRQPVSIGEWEPLRREKPKPLPANLADRIRTAATEIKDKTAPVEVLEATRGGVTDVGVRRTVIGHLVGKANNPCPALP